MTMAKLMRKISIGGINGVRGGFKGVKEAFRAMTILGLASSLKEKVSETMGVSYAFNGEFRAINRDGEEYIAPVCYIPEPAQSLLKEALENEDRMGAVEFAFDFNVVPDEKSVTGYVFECVPKLTPQASAGLAALASRVGVSTPTLALSGPDQESSGKELEAEPPRRGKAK